MKPCIPSWLAECLLLIWPNLPSLYTETPSVKLMVGSSCLLQLESGFVCAACAAHPIPTGHSEFRLLTGMSLSAPEVSSSVSSAAIEVSTCFCLSSQQKVCPCLVWDNTVSHSSVPFPFFCLPECLVPLHRGIYTAFVKLQLIKAGCY